MHMRLASLSRVLRPALLLLAMSQAAQAADIHALTIGIDDYQRLRPLQGATNDARDLADALRSAGARNIVTLLNGQADRDGIFAAWKRLKANAKPGDTLVLTFSGHGGREPERYAGSGGGDGYDEPLLLGGFSPKAPGSAQRIFDTEIGDIVREAADYNVILLIDACHSGTPTRSSKVLTLPVRWAGDYVIEDDPLPHTPPAKTASPGVPANALVIGGSLDTQLVGEVLAENKPRGPASVMLARALRGAADADRNGELSVGELYDHMIEGVRGLSEGRQEATMEFVGSRGRALFKTPPPKPAAPAPLPFALLGESPQAERELLAQLQRIQPVGGRQAKLLWDRPKQQISNELGDIVAFARSVPEAQGVIDKWQLLGRLNDLPKLTPLSVRLNGGDRNYKVGEHVDIVIQPRAEKLLVINLSPAGLVQLLYPIDEREAAARLTPEQLFRIPDVVVTDDSLGAEHVIAISAASIPPEWLRSIASMNGKPQGARLLQQLDGWLRDSPGVALGRVGLYSER